MSLINEALKKAQTDRPQSSRPEVPMDPGGMPPPQGPPRKKRYLFSFIIVVLLVGLISAMVSTYLVYQLMGDKDGAQAAREPDKSAEPGLAGTEPVSGPEPASGTTPSVAGPSIADQEVEAATQVGVDPEKAVQGSADEIVAAGQDAIAEELTIEVPDAIMEELPADSEAEPEATPVAAEENATQVVADTPPSESAPAPAYASYSNNPEVWSRLDEFEIRGIMSRGAKVLIFDSRTQKARTYTSGDLIDGAMSLRVAKISSGEIQFTNNEGSIFSKAF